MYLFIKGISSIGTHVPKIVETVTPHEDIIYSLPFGWTKICRQRKNTTSKKWDFYVRSPQGNQFRSTNEIEMFLAKNPNVPCDLSVTHTKCPPDFPYEVSHRKESIGRVRTREPNHVSPIKPKPNGTFS